MKRYMLSRLTVGTMIISAGLVLPGLGAAQAQTATPSRAAAADADAKGIDIDATVITTSLRYNNTFAKAHQTFPPGAAAPATDVVISPALAPINLSARTVGAMAGANGAPSAVAAAEVEDFTLGGTPQAPVVSADLVRGQSNSDCVNDPNAAGTVITSLKINGTEALGSVNGAFPPNTEIASPALALLGVKLVVNEQRPASNGRGFVVNALHFYDLEPNTAGALFDGDIRVGHAETTVNCPNGRGSTGLTNAVQIDKDASVATARPGTTFTYTVKINNKSTLACKVNQIVDHLAPAFEFVSTAGDLGTTSVQEPQSGGTTDIVIRPNPAKTIAAGGTVTQTYTVKVKDDAAPGTYFNTIDLLCASQGNFIAVDAPVTVPGAATGRLPQCSDKIDNDGDGKIDFPNDPGCSSAQDDSEIDFECSDRVDNDGDGKIDFPNDPGCSSATDDSETNSLPRTGAEGAVALLGGALLIGAAITYRKLRTTL